RLIVALHPVRRVLRREDRRSHDPFSVRVIVGFLRFGFVQVLARTVGTSFNSIVSLSPANHVSFEMERFSDHAALSPRELYQGNRGGVIGRNESGTILLERGFLSAPRVSKKQPDRERSASG